MSEVIEFILKTNTFNFAILALCVALICHYLHLGEKLDALKNDIVKKIEDAKLEKVNASNNLLNVKKSVENLDSEIAKKLNDAQVSAESIAKGIFTDGENTVGDIQNSTERIIISEEKTLSTELLNSSAIKAVELAKMYLQSELNNRKELHNKFIEQSIYNIDKVEI